MTQIHPTAFVSKNATIGQNVRIGAFTIVHDRVVVGDNTVIESHCEIGHPTKLANDQPLIIRNDSLIRSHSIFYAGSTFGERLVTGHRVTVRELTRAGRHLQIGTLGDIQGHCEIGDFTRMHSNVFVAHGTKIGNFVWVFPYVVFTNDPHPPSNLCMGSEIGDYAAIATMAVILPGVKVGTHALVAAHSCVGKDVEPHTVVGGVPARFLCPTSKIKLRDGTGNAAYPWPRQFTRGYPDQVVARWRTEFHVNENPSLE
ncbi:acyltransferase [Ottowia sp.]|jgi:acetyltransferase-like isoleucine patch superfamily enzyme|uniref:acyltransferase n=1 Tax=Ottowia sp. TaxID=1898956 RepID=UPI0025F7BD5D|nr:acyltransferase [Ottowia sp.]MBK6614427.1 N-acetyltransferase [Ottowia sp.]MBK6745014.1 N-acetyltransferase [Ottowia sp.]